MCVKEWSERAARCKEISEKVLSLHIHNKNLVYEVQTFKSLLPFGLTGEENLRFICTFFKLFKMASWN